ncbi:MAG: YbaB/EbfC family nucleoid-associated protein [Patescibacteria group bacterium]
MLDKVKDLYNLKKQAGALQKMLSETIIEATSPDDKIRVEMSADQKVRAISIDPEYMSLDKKQNLEFQLKNVFSSALTQSQQVAANKMKEMGGLDSLLGGMM